MQSQFPLLFFVLLISSMNLPRNLIEVTWFRDLATANPVSYLIEALRSLVIEGWNAQALALGFTFTFALIGALDAARDAPAQGEDDAHVRSRIDVALALAYRQTTVLLKNPSLFLPPMLFPLMNFLAFAGGLSRLRHVPGFEFKSGYTAFQFVFVLLQSAAFGGVFAGFGIARDFERGFAQAAARLRAATRRDHPRLRPRRDDPLADDRRRADDRRADRRHEGRRRRRRPGRDVRPGDHLQPGRAAVGLRCGDAAPLGASRAADADAGVPVALPRTRSTCRSTCSRAGSTASPASTRSRS